jgi:hypothetical protein
VDRGTRIFWALIATLVLASIFFEVNTESRRGTRVQRARAVSSDEPRR